MEDGEDSPGRLSEQEEIVDLRSIPSRPFALLRLGLFKHWEYATLPPARGSGAGKDSRFLAETIARSRSGVEGLCLGALCDRSFAFADSVAAM